METAVEVETVVRLSRERARQLGRLAAARGTTEEALVAEALDMLFRQNGLCDEMVDDAELLRRMEAELGPSRARTVPPLDPTKIEVTHVVPIRPEEIVSIIPVPLKPELIRRPGHKD